MDACNASSHWALALREPRSYEEVLLLVRCACWPWRENATHFARLTPSMTALSETAADGEQAWDAFPAPLDDVVEVRRVEKKAKCRDRFASDSCWTCGSSWLTSVCA